MNTAQVSIELVLAGILALCAFVLPFWQGADISQDLLQSDALIGVLAISYLLGVVFDKLSDTILGPMEGYLRLKQADKILNKKTGAKPKDAFPQNELEFQLRAANDGRLEWMNSLKSRIRTSRELAVLGLPASLGIVMYDGFTRDCVGTGGQACSGQWIYIFVLFNLLLFVAAAWRESRTPDEELIPDKGSPSTEEPASGDKSTFTTKMRLKTGALDHDSKKRKVQMQQARRQMHADSMIYYLMILNSVSAIAVVAVMRSENGWIALFGAGGLIVSLLSLWTCLRITRTYIRFIARSKLPVEK